MNKLQEAKQAWDNYKNWEREWTNACNRNARLEFCWKLNDYKLKARARWEKVSHPLSHAELLAVTAEDTEHTDY